MALLFFTLMILKLLVDAVMVIRAEIIVAINNPYLRYREIVSQKHMEE